VELFRVADHRRGELFALNALGTALGATEDFAGARRWITWTRPATASTCCSATRDRLWRVTTPRCAWPSSRSSALRSTGPDVPARPSVACCRPGHLHRTGRPHPGRGPDGSHPAAAGLRTAAGFQGAHPA
jgi:hypothetical protein